MGFRRKINFGSLTKSSKNTNKAIVVMRKEELNGISNARYLSTKSTTSGNVYQQTSIVYLLILTISK